MVPYISFDPVACWALARRRYVRNTDTIVTRAACIMTSPAAAMYPLLGSLLGALVGALLGALVGTLMCVQSSHHQSSIINKSSPSSWKFALTYENKGVFYLGGFLYRDYCKRFAQSAGPGYENCLYAGILWVQTAQTVHGTYFLRLFPKL